MAQYLKPDSTLGYVDDLAEIQHLKINNLRHSVLGCMLGDFDETGAYVVSEEIKNELIAMDKFIVESFDNIELCKGALVLDRQISFMVTFEGNRATLTLVEKLNYESNSSLNSGTYSNINECVLDVVETSGEINRNVIYARWNIKSIQGAMIDIFNCDDALLAKYFGIVNRFKYLLVANKILLQKEEELEEIEAEYSTSILEIVSHYPSLQKAVISDLTQTLKEKKDAVSVKKPFFAKTLNEILENAIQQNLSKLNEAEKESFIQEQRNAILTSNVKIEDALEMEHVKQDGEEIARVVLKTPSTSYALGVADLAEEFIGENKQTLDRLNGVNSNLFQRTLLRNGETATANANRNKLFESIYALGLGELVGVQKEEKQEETILESAVGKVADPKAKDKTDGKVAGAKASVGNGKDTKGKAKSGGGSSSKAQTGDKTKKAKPGTQKGNAEQVERMKMGNPFSGVTPSKKNPSSVNAPQYNNRIEKERGMVGDIVENIFGQMKNQRDAEKEAERTSSMVAGTIKKTTGISEPLKEASDNSVDEAIATINP